MATIRSYTGFLTADLGTGENVGAGDVFTIGSAPTIMVLMSDTDPLAEGDPTNEVSNDPGGDQIVFIEDGSGTVLSDGQPFYLELSFTFTDSLGATHTGYQFEIDEIGGLDFVILPPDVAPGDITVTAINFGPSPDSVDYDALTSGSETTDSADFTNLNTNTDDTILAGAGDDTVIAEGGGDFVGGGAGNDSIEGGTGSDTLIGDAGSTDGRLSFNWSLLPDPNGGGLLDGDPLAQNTGDSVTQDTGGIAVTATFTDQNGNVDLNYSTLGQNTTGIDSGTETVNTTSAGALFSTGGTGDVGQVEFSFAATNGSFQDAVENVAFRINDIDETEFRDQISIFAFGPDGNPIPVNLTGGSNHILSDEDAIPGNETVTVADGSGNFSQTTASNSLLVEIAGPVSRFIVDYGNLETLQQQVDITDIFFDPIDPTVATGDDTIVGGEGDDFIDGGSGDDSLIGDFAAGGGSPSGDAFQYEFYELNGQSPGTLADAGFDANGDNTNSPDATGTVNTIDVNALDAANGGDGETYAVKLTTTLTVTAAGTYDFALSSDDGSRLFIDGVEIIDNDGLHGVVTVNGSTTLAPGEHLIEVIFFENGGGDSLALTVSGPDTGNTAIPIESAAVAGESFDDTLLGGDGADTLAGGVGDDSLSGAADEDLIILEDAFGTDTIEGGETTTTGVDDDTVDASAMTLTGVDVTFTDNEDGTIGDGTTTSTFVEIENFVLTNQDDTVDATATTTGVNIEALDGNDTVEGGSGADSIDGGDGDDSILDGVGNDTILGGAGNDTLGDPAGIASGGADSLFGGAGDDSIYIGNGADTVDAGDDADFIYSVGSDFSKVAVGGEGGNDDDTLSWAGETDAADALNVTYGTDDEAGVASIRGQTVTFSEIEKIEGTQVADTFDASATGAGDGVWVDGQGGDDTMTGGAGEDTFLGGDGADSIAGGGGVDSIEGGIGNDTIDGGANTDFLFGGAGDDLIIDTGGVLSDDTIEGGSGNDTIGGGLREDSLSGGDDADTFLLEDSFGADTIVGGEGGTDSDIVDASGVTLTGINVQYSASETGTISDGTDTANFSEIEQFVLTDQDDTVNGFLSTDPLTLDGRDGDDILAGGQSADSILGGAGTDILGGNDGSDTLEGGDGQDVINGDAGADSILGGADADTIVLTNGFGADTIAGGETATAGGTDDDTLDASLVTGPVTVTYGGPEAGTLTDGADTLGFSEMEALLLTDGDDVVDGALDTAGMNVDAGDGADTVTGGSGVDTLLGGLGADSLTGGAGADSLVGGAGADTIVISGDDVVTGGADADTFAVSAEPGAAITITDFDPTTNNSTGTIYDPLNPGDQTDNDFVDLSAFFSGINDLRAANLAPDGSDVVLDLGNGQTLTLQGVTDVNLLNFESTNVICFTPGTMIATPSGPRRIETLREGDRVLTRDNGPQPIAWVGDRTLSAGELAAAPRLRPITIAPEALGGSQALTVSPQHRLLIEGARAELMFDEPEVLVPAVSLLGGDMAWRADVPGVRYIHLLFERHEVIWANGVATESLHPGDQALDALAEAGRQEVVTLFPDLATGPARQTARMALSVNEARAMLRL